MSTPGHLSPETTVDGRYRLLERIGAGGMAEVWAAEDQQLGRRVALKLLYRRFSDDPEFVKRFEREASSAAGLQHPNVVNVYDRGEWDGTPYIAMELLEGDSLKAIINEHAPLDPVWAIDITLQILRAARFAHKAGIIHRDIKPHNVLVDAEGRAKVTDFGIARAGASDMTETGSIMGTAQYLSPEQAQGHAVSAASDLYSVGIVLYEMLTGRVPFDGDSAVTIALKQVSEAPVPPSHYAEVPPDLEAVVMHALEKDPAVRFSSADDFIASLERVRARIVSGEPPGEGTVVFGALPADAVADPERGRRWPWIVAIALVLLIAGAALVYALTRPGDTKEVPNVTGIQLDAAAAALQNEGFEVEVERVQNEARRDRVLRQDPQPGEKVEEGSTVTLIVSDGPGQILVPDVRGLSEDEARERLEDEGFRVDSREEPDEEVEQGDVIGTSPEAGTRLERGDRVTLIVSSGPEQLTVPNVVGEDRDTAISRLEAAGFQVDVEEEASTSSPEGTVLRQNPTAGTPATAGSSVQIVVAQAVPQVTVPGVQGQTESAAASALRGAGLRVAVSDVTVDSEDQDGIVQGQNPGAGDRVPEGTTVRIQVGRFEEPDQPTTPADGTDPGN